MFLVLLALVPFIGHEVNGARRWIDLGISDLQPSEFLKPLFIVTTAWMLSFRPRSRAAGAVRHRRDDRADRRAADAAARFRPDDRLRRLVWVILLMISGISPRAIGGLGGTAIAGVVAAYLFYGTARTRIDNFLFPTKEAALVPIATRLEMAHARSPRAA
jgi:cell division protein FtsW